MVKDKIGESETKFFNYSITLCRFYHILLFISSCVSPIDISSSSFDRVYTVASRDNTKLGLFVCRVILFENQR